MSGPSLVERVRAAAPDAANGAFLRELADRITALEAERDLWRERTASADRTIAEIAAERDQALKIERLALAQVKETTAALESVAVERDLFKRDNADLRKQEQSARDLLYAVTDEREGLKTAAADAASLLERLSEQSGDKWEAPLAMANRLRRALLSPPEGTRT